MQYIVILYILCCYGNPVFEPLYHGFLLLLVATVGATMEHDRGAVLHSLVVRFQNKLWRRAIVYITYTQKYVKNV